MTTKNKPMEKWQSLPIRICEVVTANATLEAITIKEITPAIKTTPAQAVKVAEVVDRVNQKYFGG